MVRALARPRMGRKRAGRSRACAHERCGAGKTTIGEHAWFAMREELLLNWTNIHERQEYLCMVRGQKSNATAPGKIGS